MGLDDFRMPKHTLVNNTVLFFEPEWRLCYSLLCLVLESLILFLDATSKGVIVRLRPFILAENGLEYLVVKPFQSKWVPPFDFEYFCHLSVLSFPQTLTSKVTREESPGLPETLLCYIQ